MCPICISTAGCIVASATLCGAAALLALQALRVLPRSK
jgi:hypothetical protein